MSASQISHVVRLIGYFIIHLPSILVIYWQTRMFITTISGEHDPSRRFTRLHHLIAAGFGELIYDLSTVQDPKSNRCSIASSVVYLAMTVRLSDDILDNPNNTNVQKNAFLDRLEFALRHDSGTQAQEEFDTAEIIPLQISRKLFVSVFSRDSQNVSQSTWDKLVACARKQLIETEPEILLGLEQTIARLTLEMFVLIVEISEGVENRALRTALGFMGGYGLSLDNIRDIDSDLKDGTRTYGTTTLM